MNANCYKIIFSKRLGSLVAVGEHTSSTGKAASGQACRSSVVADGFVGALRFTFASVALACLSLGHTQAQSTAVALASTALPQGGSISTGSATISANGAAMAINQSTDKASINWQSFNIGSAASVNIAQPSANSVLLNRVVGNDPSQVLGKLSANGQVILLNPNGVMFGKDGSVTASSFTASTFALNDADFMAGYYKYARNGNTAAVVNQGTIETSAGGFVALIGATVTNEGTIRVPQGDVVMAAADSITLPTELVKPQPVTTPHTVSVRMSKRVRLELDPAAINTAVNNTESGVIVTEGGQVLMQAAALSTAVASVTHSGRIDSSAPQAGAVTLLADHGVIKVDGSITANSSGHDGKGQANKGGDIIIGRDDISGQLAASTDVRGAKLESQKGFVETSGDHLTTDGISVKAAEWLLDPSDITISSSTDSNVTGVSPADITPNGGTGTSSIVQVNTIQTAINAGTNVTIKTTNALNSTGAGNITISNALSLNNTGAQDATLSLIADNGIIQNAAITGTGTKLVNINMTANGNYQGNTAASANSKGITLNAGITTNGSITLTGTNQSGAADGAGAGVYINRQTVDAGTSDVMITGTATDGSGTFINGVSTIRGRNVTIGGTANTSASNKSGTGVYLYRDNTTTIAATNNLDITGTVTGTGTGNGLRSNGGNGGSAILMTAGGTATLKGIQRGNANNTSSAVYLSGFRVNATGDVTIQAEAANSNSLAIHMNREAGALNGYDDWRMQARSTSGNVLIQSNQGSILGQDISGGVNISGRNVTLDNTGAGMTINGVPNANGGSIDAATGAIVMGSGTSTYSAAVSNIWAGTWVPLGVSLNGQNSTASITATGNLTIGGSSSSGQGIAIGNSMSITGNINLAGRSSAASTNGLNITQALTSTGDISLTGESTNASPGVGVNLGAEIKTTSNNSTTKLTSTTGAVSGSGNITTALGNTGNITVSTAAAGTLSGVISGGGSLVKQGTGATTLTTSNTYSGTTTISTGTLQIGNATTTGSLGTGAVTNNAALTFNRSNAMTVGNAIAGTGSVNQIGAGTTTLTANNSYSGASTVNGGTLQVGNGGATGTLGSGDVTLANGSSLAYNRNTATVINNNISGNGNVSATITGNLDVARTINLTTANNTVNLTASGNITESAGSITATNLYLTATNGSIGAAGNRINTNVSNLAMVSAGDQFATQANALRLASRTTNAGNIDVNTTNGTLTVGSVNGVNGVTASSSGNITLEGTSNSSDGLVIESAKSVTSSAGNISITGNSTGANGTGLNIGFNGSISTAGDVDLTGTTTADNRTAGTFAAVTNAGSVTASNITLSALASNTTADVLGYYGAGGNLIASHNLTANAESRGAGVGYYMYAGKAQSGTGMSITGISNTDIGIALDNVAQVLNQVSAGSATGDLVISGSTNSATRGGVAFIKTAIENTASNGGVQITADKGDMWANYGQPSTVTNAGSGAIVMSAGPTLASDAGAIDGTKLTITQNGSGGVQVRTSGAGNITTPKIVNAGTGNVIVAAGSSVSAGTATGGQVLTLSGNTITNNNGKTYIYSGSAANTGVLSNLSADFATLYYQGTSHAVNTAFNKAYDGTPANDLSAPAGGSVTNGAQAFFRSTTKPGFSLAVDDLTKAYGDTDPTTFSITGGASTLTSNYAGVGGNNTFAVASADVLSALTGTRVVGENVGSYAYTLDGVAMNATLSAQPDLNITKRDITLTSVTAADKQYNGDTIATISGGVFGNLVGVETLSLSGSGVYAAPNAGNGKVVSVADVTTLNKVNGTGLWSNYNLTTTGGVSGTGNITQAPLTLTVNNSSVFVTQNASTAPDNGFSYAGFVNGDTSAVLTGTPTRTYTGAANYLVAGTYQDVLGASNVPTATNYAVTTVVAGDLVVTPADKLLIGIGSQTNAYGSQTASNLGTAASGTVSARYCFVANNCNGANLVDLTVTQLSTNQWKATDNTGSYVVFSTSLDTPSYSSGGYLNVGNYTYTASEIAPLSLTNGNFNGRATNGGVLTVNPLAVNLSHATVSKAYDGTTALPTANQPNNTLTASNAKSGDALSVSFGSGSYAASSVSASASFSLLGVQLTGNDASNYSLANYANSTYTATGVITDGSSDGGKTPFVHPPKPIIPTDNSSGGGTSGGESTSGNPYLVIPAGRPNSADRCTPNTLENCLCETQEPKPIEGLAICYQPKKTASSTSNKAKRS